MTDTTTQISEDEAQASIPQIPLKEIIDRCRTEFRAFREGLPLAIGVHKAMMERIQDISGRRLRSAISFHTSSSRYLKAIAHGTARYDLDGNVCGEVTEEQRKVAAQELWERAKKDATRRREAEAAKVHQQKLQGLANKFNSR